MYLCSENKGADQLSGYRAADLRLCFSHMQKPGFIMLCYGIDTGAYVEMILS